MSDSLSFILDCTISPVLDTTLEISFYFCQVILVHDENKYDFKNHKKNIARTLSFFYPPILSLAWTCPLSALKAIISDISLPNSKVCVYTSLCSFVNCKR